MDRFLVKLHKKRKGKRKEKAQATKSVNEKVAIIKNAILDLRPVPIKTALLHHNDSQNNLKYFFFYFQSKMHMVLDGTL